MSVEATVSQLLKRLKATDDNLEVADRSGDLFNSANDHGAWTHQSAYISGIFGDWPVVSFSTRLARQVA